MVGKWTLQLLGTVLMFIVGIFNFYKEEIPLTENSCLKEITLMNDRINMDFREQLKITTQYFEKLLNSYKCNKSNSPTVSVNYNYRKILILACESAEDIYLYNRLYNYTSDYLIPSRIKTIKNAIPFACGKQPERLKEIYESIYQFLNLYYTNFPNERNGIEYNTCYVVSLLEFSTLEELINSNDTKLSRSLEIAKKCVPLKLHKENSTAKYFSKKMSNNSKSVNYQLHRKDKTFKNHLKLVTKFFKSILKHCEFSKFSENVNSNTEEWKISKIIWFISISAKDNYSFHSNDTFKFNVNLSNFTRRVLPSISRECDKQLKENLKLIQNMYQLFNMYHKNYPLQFIEDDYSKCFIKSVENIMNINLNVFYIFQKDPNYGKKSINDIVTKNLVSIMKCVELKEHL